VGGTGEASIILVRNLKEIDHFRTLCVDKEYIKLHSSQNVVMCAGISIFFKHQTYIEFPKLFASGRVLTSKINHGSSNPCPRKHRISG
jgi:hypothetical protein